MPNFPVRARFTFLSLAIIAAAATIGGCSSGSSNTTTGTGGTSATGTGGATAGTGGATAIGTGGTTTGTGGATAGTGGATAGTGGTTAGTDAGMGGAMAGTDGGLPTTGVCAGAGTRKPASGKVDDFEAAPILGGWSSFNDVMPTHDVFKIKREAGGAVSTGFAGHYTGMGAITPAMGGFGAGTLYNIAIDHQSNVFCIDVTGYDGLTFWAKAATDGAKVGVNFIVPATNPPPDGDCQAACFDHPQKAVLLTTQWAQYTVPFADATGGGGVKVTGVVQQLGWLTTDSNWDFWIDEIQFYKGTPPTTAVGGNSTM